MKKHTERDHANYMYDMHDAYLMDLVESFIESAPQVILQMYILLTKEESDFITTVSVLISGVTVASSLVQYNKALREAHYPPEQRLSVPGAYACEFSSVLVCFKNHAIAIYIYYNIKSIIVKPLQLLVIKHITCIFRDYDDIYMALFIYLVPFGFPWVIWRYI